MDGKTHSGELEVKRERMKTMIQQKNMSQPEKSQSGKQSTLPTVLQAYKDRITQRQSVEEEELLQPKFDPSQMKQNSMQFHTQSNVVQRKASREPIQLKTQILSQQDQQYNFGTGSINVGKFVEVGLDPNDMHQGQSANLNTAQDDMMSAIRSKWGITGGGLVKGHLWNDNLGGSAMNYNLYPITKAANSDHLGYVENKAKEYVWNKQPIYYRVEVDANPVITDSKADFDCEIRSWDPTTGKLGSRLFGPVTIESDLNNVGAYNEAYETYTGNTADRQKRPKKPKWAQNPKTRVGELTKQELKERQNQ